MAYAFDSIMNALGQGEDEQQNQAQQSQPSQGLGLTQEGGFQGGAGGGTGQAQNQPAQNSTSATNTLVQRNRSKARSPIDTQALNQNIGGAKTAIKQEEQNYLDRADDPYEFATPGIADSVKAYAQGDTRSPISTLYNKQPSLVDDIELKTDTSFNDTNLLQSDAGIRELYRRGADPEYNIGEAALDSALLRGNKEFQLGRDEVLRSYRSLLDERSRIEQGARDSAQSLRDDAADAYNVAVRDAANTYVADYEKDLFDAEVDRDRTFQQQINSAASADQLNAQANAALAELQKEIQDPDLLQYLNADDDLRQYYNSASVDDTQWQDFLTRQDADRFNRIMGLLGSGKIYSEGQYAGGLNDVSTGSFDTNAFKKAAFDRATAARQAELDRQAAIEKQLQEQAAVNDAENQAEQEAAAQAAEFDANATTGRRATNTPMADEQNEVRDTIDTELGNFDKGRTDAWERIRGTNLSRRWG